MSPLTFSLDLHRISFVLNFGLTHRGCMFPMAFVNTSQDWLNLQISLASLRVAHMASHWRMTVDVAKFNRINCPPPQIVSSNRMEKMIKKGAQAYLLHCYAI
jgi:hypothetical protein